MSRLLFAAAFLCQLLTRTGAEAPVLSSRSEPAAAPGFIALRSSAPAPAAGPTAEPQTAELGVCQRGQWARVGRAFRTDVCL